MTHFTAAMNAFDMRRVADWTQTERVDPLMRCVGEIVGVSMRIDDYDELIGANRTNSTRRHTAGSRTSTSTGHAGVRPRDGGLCHVASGR